MLKMTEALEVKRTAEQEMADQLPIGASEEAAEAVLERVPFWFHTFALNGGGTIYTPGIAKDHRYRLGSIPQDFSGLSVLDVGTFDGFYAFLAEHRGASRVLATDNEQYRAWVKERWHVVLQGSEGFRETHELLGSSVEYRVLDAFELDKLDERFDLIFCFGILHRVENPLGLLRILSDLLNEHGRIILETYGVLDKSNENDGFMQAREPGDVYANDGYVYWGFSGGALRQLALHAKLNSVEVHDTPMIDGHPRIIGTLSRANDQAPS